MRRKIRRGEYRLTEHAQIERLEEDIDVLDIEAAILSGEVLEDYPNDPRGPSCLILGHSDERAIHVVCGVKQNQIVIITVYIPQPPKWENPRSRRK